MSKPQPRVNDSWPASGIVTLAVLLGAGYLAYTVYNDPPLSTVMPNFAQRLGDAESKRSQAEQWVSQLKIGLPGRQTATGKAAGAGAGLRADEGRVRPVDPTRGGCSAVRRERGLASGAQCT